MKSTPQPFTNSLATVYSDPTYTDS